MFLRYKYIISYKYTTSHKHAQYKERINYKQICCILKYNTLDPTYKRITLHYFKQNKHFVQ